MFLECHNFDRKNSICWSYKKQAYLLFYCRHFTTKPLLKARVGIRGYGNTSVVTVFFMLEPFKIFDFWKSLNYFAFKIKFRETSLGSNAIVCIRLWIKSHSSALLISRSRYILRLGQRERCCFCAACPNRKMYLEIRSANERACSRWYI